MNSSEIVVSVNVNTIFTPYNVAGNRILSKSFLLALQRSIGRAMIGVCFVFECTFLGTIHLVSKSCKELRISSLDDFGCLRK